MLVLVMTAVAAAVILSCVYAAEQGIAVQISHNIGARTHARTIAESGLEMAVAYVQSNDLWREGHVEGLWVPDQALGGGAFSIYAHDGYDTDGDGIVDGDGDLADDWMDPLTLTAVGTYQGARHTVQAVVPPVKWALMICDPDNLSPEDTVRLALMRGAGWRVRLLRAQATGAEFDEAVANMHVVYFPAHTPLETDVKNRLKGLSLPIVTGHAQLVKELKIASGDSRAYEDEFIDVLELQRRVTDDAGQEVLEVYTHHITAPFAVGPVRICSKPSKLLRLDGPAVGTLALASVIGQPDQAALAVLECGALRTDERPARARRVALPWGSSDSDFSIESLTTEGQQFLLRSLDWAAGSWRGYLPGIAVWEKIEVLGMAGIDGFASAIGPYGGGNVNGDCTLSSNSVGAGDIRLAGGVVNGHVFVSPDANMGTVIDLDPGCALLGTTRYLSLNVPVLVPQPFQNMPASVGDRVYATGLHIVDTDRHYRKLTIRGDATVFVIGDRRILCDDDVVVKESGRLIVEEWSKLTFYARKNVYVDDGARVNTLSGNPTQLNLLLEKDKLEVMGSSQMYAVVSTYDGAMAVREDGGFCGTFVGKKVKVDNSARFHIDTSNSGTTITLGGGYDLAKLGLGGVHWVER